MGKKALQVGTGHIAPGKLAERRDLVGKASAKLRELILAREPGAQIGSLNEVSALLGVGIVSVQQAARVLEHEGLLAVRRGPGGGYYGARPDDAALERSLATYLRVHCSVRSEAREILSMVDCELAAAAAECSDEQLRTQLKALGERLDACHSPSLRVAWEGQFRAQLFRMVDRRFFELISRVAIQVYDSSASPIYAGEAGVAAWRREQGRIIAAILKQDSELARFEAERHRRSFQARVRRIERLGGTDAVDAAARPPSQ
jgi:GntR family transcriptional regulator, transcriptional repressor for pyruvate dehydrogenase complex